MTNKTTENILSLYDEALNKTKALRDLAKTFNVPRDELKTILIDNGRDVPYAKKKKQDDEQKDEAKEDDPDRTAVPEVLPVPQAVLETLAKEMDALATLPQASNAPCAPAWSMPRVRPEITKAPQAAKS